MTLQQLHDALAEHDAITATQGKPPRRKREPFSKTPQGRERRKVRRLAIARKRDWLES